MISSVLLRLRPGMSLVDLLAKLANDYPDIEVGGLAGGHFIPLVIEAMDGNGLETIHAAIRSWPEVDSLDVVSVFLDDSEGLRPDSPVLEKSDLETGVCE
jgi:hypothetical protein